jgi:hypothetical protein
MIFRILDESQYLHVKYYISTQTFSKCHRFFFENDAEVVLVQRLEGSYEGSYG